MTLGASAEASLPATHRPGLACRTACRSIAQTAPT